VEPEAVSPGAMARQDLRPIHPARPPPLSGKGSGPGLMPKWSWFRRRSTVFADLTGSRNDQCGRLCDLFQVVAGDSAAEDDQPRMDGRLDAAQRPVTAGAQRALDAFGQAEVLLASLSEQGRPRAASVSSPVRSREGWISRAADWVMDHSSFLWDTHLRASRSMISVEPLLSSAFGPNG
jgi:hypothetical protein